MSNNIDILLVGCGNMGKEYAKVINALGRTAIAVGRSESNAIAFEEATGIKAYSGGIESVVDSLEYIPKKAIIAVGTMVVKEVLNCLIRKGVQDILVEKPAGMNSGEIEEIVAEARKHNTNIYVAYNRRYYASVRRAKEIIEEDGGVDSFNFEFTEWGHVLAGLNKPQEELNAWFLLNSSHVLDLAFYLGGKPKEIASFTGGQNQLDWHKKCSKYSGAGITDSGALFSYQANYGAPGRWVVEILTRKHRLYFKPVEQLGIQEIGSVRVDPVEIDDQIDKDFKPGLYLETKAFIDGEEMLIPTIEEQLENVLLYERIEK